MPGGGTFFKEASAGDGGQRMEAGRAMTFEEAAEALIAEHPDDIFYVPGLESYYDADSLETLVDAGAPDGDDFAVSDGAIEDEDGGCLVESRGDKAAFALEAAKEALAGRDDISREDIDEALEDDGFEHVDFDLSDEDYAQIAEAVTGKPLAAG